MIPMKCTAVGIVLRECKVVFVRCAEFVTVVRGVLCLQVVLKEWCSADVVCWHDVAVDFCITTLHVAASRMLLWGEAPCAC